MNQSSDNSTSAAAMADSAGTVVATNAKLMEGNLAEAESAKNVKLLIKASNQQFDDHTIECDLQWSVKRLKMHLSLVYPCKPAVSEQKLIYSGQLLNDSLLLKDVIRSYKDVLTQHHIFHLVCASKYMQPSSAKQIPKANSTMSSTSTTSTSVTTEGMRHRNNLTSRESTEQENQAPTQNQLQQGQQQQQQQQPTFHTLFNSSVMPQMVAGANGGTNTIAGSNCPNFNTNPGAGLSPLNFPGHFNMQSMASQQAIMYNWMHQVYSQYMDQYLRLSNSVNAGVPTVAGSAGASNSASSSNVPPLNTAPFATAVLFPQMPFMANNLPAEHFATLAASGTAAPSVIPIQNPIGSEAAVSSSMPQVTATATVAGTEQRLNADASNRTGGTERQVPRFPANIAQNDQESNDWLDILFSIARLGIFLMILIFNASPLRCIYVILIASVLYLYQNGHLRFLRERNNNDINRNNNAGDAINEIRQGVQNVQEAQAQQQQPDAEENQVNPPQPPVEASSPAAESSPIPLTAAFATKAAFLMSFIRTFVVSFFVSLLPEQQTQ